MTRWAYKVELFGSGHPQYERQMREGLTRLGREGWELVSVQKENNYHTMYFKRPIRVAEVVTSPRHS